MDLHSGKYHTWKEVSLEGPTLRGRNFYNYSDWNQRLSSAWGKTQVYHQGSRIMEDTQSGNHRI